MKASAGNTCAQTRRSGHEWVCILARYRKPSNVRSLFELLATFIPFALLIGLAWRTLAVSYPLAAAVSAVNGAFLVRLFVIQHDCGHGSFFTSRQANDWLGRILAALTLTPYDIWKRTHSIHHSVSGNLDRRGLGDVLTLTVSEYRARSAGQRLAYRIYRNPLFLFGVMPAFVFFLQFRLPIGLMHAGTRYWISALATNAAIAMVIGAGIWFGGLRVLLLVFLPTALVGAAAGMWLFYVQHQFEGTYWSKEADWQLHEAALEGSSHYVLPPVLRWLTGNIGAHHVHHLYSRIPFYRLPEVLRDCPELDRAQRLTMKESLHCARLHLWDEKGRRLLTFSEARSV